MQSYFRNALLALAALAAFVSTSQTAHAQGEGAVTITVAEPTEFAGQVLAPGAYILRKPFGEWYLTLEEKTTHRKIAFVRYQNVSERDGAVAQLKTAALNDAAPAKVAITSVYIPTIGREFTFALPKAAQAMMAIDSAGK